jgi:hypothetical protein
MEVICSCASYISLLSNVRNLSRRHVIESSSKKDVLYRKMLNHMDWQIVIDVSKDRNALIFGVNQS